jgi:hypothetical protein
MSSMRFGARLETWLIVDRRIRSEMPGILSRFLWIGEERERSVGTPGIEQRDVDHVDRDAGVTMRQMGGELMLRT